MISSFLRSTAPGLAALLLASASVVSAQYADRPGDRLSRYLRELATDPTSLSALIGAGQAAIEVGDGNAALGFFARADERSPRNGQVKAGLARALLMVDNPREALKMFDAARALGVAEVDIAADRGLAYDLKGDNRKAQHDYALALTRGPNDDVTKRYALSLGITGDKDQALSLIDPLLYKRDQGAWRARAFVLAMNNDLPGASRIVHQVMPERMAQTMDPFLSKLGGLNAAQRAAAVHLGEMPNNARMAQASPAIGQPGATYVAPVPTPTPTPEPREVRKGSRSALLVASPPPQKEVRAARSKGKKSRVPVPVATPTPPPPPPPIRVVQFEDPADYAARPTPTPTPTPVAARAASRSFPKPTPTPTPTPVTVRAAANAAPIQPSDRGDLEAIMRDIRSAAASGAPVRTPAPVRVAQATPRPTPTPTPHATPTPPARGKEEPAKADPKKSKTELAECKSVAKKGKNSPAKNACPPDSKEAKQAALAELAECKPVTKKGKNGLAKNACPPDSKEAKQAALKKKAEPKNPARYWVQVAGGANVGALPREWTSLASKVPELKARGPWTAKNRATNRLLAGPYKSEDEAQAAVAKLRKAGIGAFQWHSDEGEPVDKLGSR